VRKSLIFRDALFICTGLCPKDLGHSPNVGGTYSGKSKTFRTSGGKAAKRFKPPQNPIWSEKPKSFKTAPTGFFDHLSVARLDVGMLKALDERLKLGRGITKQTLTGLCALAPVSYQGEIILSTPDEAK
jgi:hypothetical protein